MALNHRILFAIALATLTTSGPALALSLGGSIGRAQLDPGKPSNVETIHPDTKTSANSPGWSFSLSVQHSSSDYFFYEMGVSDIGHIEKVVKASYNSGGAAHAAKITTKESLTALHFAFVSITSIGSKFALFAKAGPAMHESKYSVKQIIHRGDSRVSNESDSTISSNRRLSLFGGVGGLYSISQSISLKMEYEEFDLLGKGTRIDSFDIAGTSNKPKAAGVNVKRTMLGLLYHFY